MPGIKLPLSLSLSSLLSLALSLRFHSDLSLRHRLIRKYIELKIGGPDDVDGKRGRLRAKLLQLEPILVRYLADLQLRKLARFVASS